MQHTTLLSFVSYYIIMRWGLKLRLETSLFCFLHFLHFLCYVIIILPSLRYYEIEIDTKNSLRDIYALRIRTRTYFIIVLCMYLSLCECTDDEDEGCCKIWYC
jgi:hypothetical protein